MLTLQPFFSLSLRLMRLLPFLSVVLALGSCTTSKPARGNPEWLPLFNGHDLQDWVVKIQHHEVGENAGNTFRVVDGMIQVRYDQYGDFNDQFGHLYYKIPLSYYHLKLEYRFVGALQKGAPSYTLRNSGVMFHSQDPRTMPKEQDWPYFHRVSVSRGAGGWQAPAHGQHVLARHADRV
jgi:hypothetical protein